MLGSRETMAGRSMPSRVLSTNREMAMSAPVLPALTQASASLDLTRSMATRMEEPFLLRRATAGDSSIFTTSAAWRTVMRSLASAPSRSTLVRNRSSSARMSCSSPTRMTRASALAARKFIAAGTVTGGPKSPPMQSTATAMRIGPLLRDQHRRGAGAPAVHAHRCMPVLYAALCTPMARPDSGLVVLALDHFLAAVVAARADVVPQVHLARGGLHRQRRRGEEIVRPVHAALGRRLLVLLNCHVLLLVPKSSILAALRLPQRRQRRERRFGFALWRLLRLLRGGDLHRRAQIMRRHHGQKQHGFVFHHPRHIHGRPRQHAVYVVLGALDRFDRRGQLQFGAD